MPCDRIQTTQLDFGKVDPETLAAALNALGLNATVSGRYVRFTSGSYSGETLTLAENYSGKSAEERKAEIKQAYSGQVVRNQARRQGWTIKETGKNKFQIIKRTV